MEPVGFSSPPSIAFDDLFLEFKNKEVFSSNKIRSFAKQRLKEIQREHLLIKHAFQEGNRDSFLLERIKGISLKCLEDFPPTGKQNQLEMLKGYFANIEGEYRKLELALTKKERDKKEFEKRFIGDCGVKKSQLLRNEQEEFDQNLYFNRFLKEINQKFNESLRETIFFAYASPTDSRYEKESWVQPFLKNLQGHLKQAGFPIVRLDIVSTRYGENINTFLEGARSSGYVLLFGTESLLDKYSGGVSEVCTMLVQIMRKRQDEARRVFPILLSGEHQDALPAEYELLSKVDWREKSYLYNFQHLFLELLGLPPERYQEKLERIWERSSSEASTEPLPQLEWYQKQREKIDACRRSFSIADLNSIKIKSLRTGFLKRLKKHYLDNSTISVMTFREKGKWELSLPVDTLYTKLVMIAENEREERNDFSLNEDGRFPNHETIFEAKVEVNLEEIFQLAKNNRAVIYGSAGIGKTTFVTMLLYKWALGELFSEFQTILCVRLRNLTSIFYPNTHDHVYHVDDVLKKEYNALGVDSLNHDPRSTLLVLDGWDELPFEAREGHLYTAFQELQERYPNLLITSRPKAIDLDDMSEFEILGFTDTHIEEYISQFFAAVGSNDSKIIEMNRFINKNPLAKSLAHIPINLSILCALLDKEESFFTFDAPLTISSLYERMINQFYKISLIRKGYNRDILRTKTRLKLHKEIRSLAACLGEIAFKAAREGVVYTRESLIEDIVYEKDIDIEDLEKIGLFKIENGLGNFIHLTFQDFFAAVYIAGCYESSSTRGLEIVQEIKFIPSFALTLSMVAGILFSEHQGELVQRYFHDLFCEPRDLAESYELILFARCFQECRNPNSIPPYVGFIERVANFIRDFPIKQLVVPIFQGNQEVLYHQAILNLLLELLDEKTIRSDFLQALVDLSSSSAQIPLQIIQKLETCIPKDDVDSFEKMIFIFEAAGGEEVKQILLSFISDSDMEEYVRILAIDAIGELVNSGERIGDEGIKVIFSFITNPSIEEHIRFAVAEVLQEIIAAGEKVAETEIAALYSFIFDEEIDRFLRYSGADALGELLVEDSEHREKVLTDLKARLGSDQNERYMAAYASGEIAQGGSEVGQKTIKALISILSDSNEGYLERLQSTKAIGKIATNGEKITDKCINTLVSILLDHKEDENIRFCAADAIGAAVADDKKTREGLTKKMVRTLLSSEESQGTYYFAVYMLGAIACTGVKIGEEGINALTLLLNREMREDVWTEVGIALGEIASAGEVIGEKGIEALISCLLDSERGDASRGSVAKSLGKISAAGEPIGEKGIGALVSLFSNHEINEELRSQAAPALKKIALSGEQIGKQHIKILISFLADEEVVDYERSRVAQTIGEIAATEEQIDAEDIDVVFSFLSSIEIDSEERSYAAKAIGKFASKGIKIGEEGIKGLIDCLSDPNGGEFELARAAKALGKSALLGEKVGTKGIATLVDLALHPGINKRVLRSAIRALGEIPSKQLATCFGNNGELIKKCCYLSQRALFNRGNRVVISDPIR